MTGRLLRSLQLVAQPVGEGAPAGTQFETIYLGGGGTYYFEEVIREALQDCQMVRVPDPEYANICGYAELAASLDEERWEVN